MLRITYCPVTLGSHDGNSPPQSSTRLKRGLKVFDFRKTVLKPLITEITGKVDDAAKIQSVGDRIESLLSLKDDIRTRYSKIINGQMAKLVIAFIAAQPLAIIGAVIASPAAPILSFAVFVGTLGYSYKKLFNAWGAQRDRARLKDKIDTAAKMLATTYPEEAVKSPRFLSALKKRFNLASAGETELNQLRAALVQAPVAPQPKPAV
jgi:hypothetical protein